MTEPIRVYVPDPELDLAIARAWLRMEEVGDVARIFTSGARTLSSFFGMIQPPRGLLFMWNAREGVWALCWYEDFMGCPAIGFWLDPRARSRRGLLAWLAMTGVLFERTTCPAIVGVTAREEMLDEYRRLGHTILGTMPLWEGAPAWVFYLSREAHARTEARYRRGAAVAATNGRA